MIVLNFLVICLDLTGIFSCGQEGRLYLNTNSTKSCRVARMRLYNFGNATDYVYKLRFVELTLSYVRRYGEFNLKTSYFAEENNLICQGKQLVFVDKITCFVRRWI